MKMMNKFLSFSLLFLLFTVTTSATEVFIAGNVVFGPSGEPAPGYPIWAFSADSTAVETTTNDLGIYELTIDVDFNAPNQVVEVVVNTFDLCTGEALSQTITVSEQNIQIGGINFQVCAEIDPPPPPNGCEAFFSWEQISVDPYTIQFADLSYSADPIQSWSWDFGDGNTSTEATPSHDYQGPGSYEVLLTINADSCSNTFVGVVIVRENLDCICPTIFDPVCVVTAADTITFSNPCEAECEGFSPEDFVECGEYNPCDCPNDYNPVCVITAEGFFAPFPNPCFAICAGFDQSTWVACDTTGNEGCQAIFHVEQEDFESLTVTFVDNSFSYDGEITSWSWDFGDGSTGDEMSPTHTYAEAGVYEVTLTITTDSGCTSVFTQHICIGIIDDCVCDEVYDPVCIATPGGIILTFSNACEAECAGFRPEHFVECNDTGECSCPPSFAPVCVVSGADTLSFTNPCFAECEGFGPEDFVDCTNVGDCICYEIYAPVCVWIDSTIVTFPNDCYAECAGFTPNDFVDCESGGGNQCNCPDIFAPVCVGIDSIDNVISFPNACEAECAGFSQEDFIDCDPNFPCDCPFILAPVCVINEAGVIESFPNACVANCEGYGEDQFVDCNNPDSLGCVAIFYAEQPDSNGLVIHFIDNSFATNDQVVQWIWDFGDGTVSEEPSPIHEYPEEGFYEVTLTIITSEGCTSTLTQPIYVYDDVVHEGPECQAVFYFEQVPDQPNTFQFANISFGPESEYHWDFGDGNTSNEANPTHTYEANGAYIVTLTVTSGNCESAASMLLITNDGVIYNNQCTALFVPFVDSTDSQVFFLNLSSSDAVSYLWDFGDGTTSTEFIAQHVYSEPGVYEISLTITTADGCSNTYIVTLDLQSHDFTGSPEFSVISDTEEETREDINLNFFPNPVQNMLNIQFKTIETEDISVAILNLNGQVMYNSLIGKQKGAFSTQMNVSDLPSGLYLIRVQTSNQHHTMKFIKQ